MIANAITLSRLPLLTLIVILLYRPAATPQLIAAPLIAILILLDTFDGVVARSLHQTSLLGSVLDIAADRTVEFILWVVFADVDMLSIVIPLVVLARGTFVDAIRAVAPARGVAPFDLMRSRLSRFLVKSPWLRTTYGLTKALAFVTLAIAYGLRTAGSAAFAPVNLVAQTAAWLAFALCLLRGLPVLIEAPTILAE